jgi:hypothetical protein
VALRINNAYGLASLQSGVGIASLADYIVAADSNLVQIDLPIELPEFDSYFVYPEELKETKRITAFRDFIVSKAKDRQAFEALTLLGHAHLLRGRNSPPMPGLTLFGEGQNDKAKPTSAVNRSIVMT